MNSFMHRLGRFNTAQVSVPGLPKTTGRPIVSGMTIRVEEANGGYIEFPVGLVAKFDFSGHDAKLEAFSSDKIIRRVRA